MQYSVNLQKCKYHVKKSPVFKSILNTSIISTTDNEDWRHYRPSKMLGKYNPKRSNQRRNFCG